MRRCGRCSKIIDADEYARSQKAFQRTYCDACFDEVFLQRRNWETQAMQYVLISTCRSLTSTLNTGAWKRTWTTGSACWKRRNSTNRPARNSFRCMPTKSQGCVKRFGRNSAAMRDWQELL